MKITRSDVLRAIAKEPLVAGCFTDARGCRACAVGSVLRRKNPKLEAAEIDQLASVVCCGYARRDQDTIDALKQKKWLGAISIKFEQLAEERAGKKGFPYTGDLTQKDFKPVRRALRSWIQENIPKGVIYCDDPQSH